MSAFDPKLFDPSTTINSFVSTNETAKSTTARFPIIHERYVNLVARNFIKWQTDKRFSPIGETFGILREMKEMLSEDSISN